MLEPTDHLLLRTGFGLTSKDRKVARQQGFDETLNRLFRDLGPHTEPRTSPPINPLPDFALPVTLLTFGRGLTWWLGNMVTTSSPLSERLTLFWHRHFATSGAKVFRPGWMFEQNLTFRRYGHGRFSALLSQMMKDKALLRWLDADKNNPEKPNENLGRELMELFTLGRENYSERDVKELAKLTTGKPAGPLYLLGKKGETTLEEFVEELALHRDTAQRVITSLWEDFVAVPLPVDELQRLVGVWQRSRGHIAVTLRAILRSTQFQSAHRQRVLTPVEYLVTCARMLEIQSFSMEVAGRLERAGELLFFPPNVKGWQGGTAIIHPSSLQCRLEMAQDLVAKLSDKHFALLGLDRTSDKASFLETLSGGQLQASTLRKHLVGLDKRESLLLGLTSPDLWTC